MNDPHLIVEKIKVPESATLREAMTAVGAGARGLACVCDGSGATVGLLTDGDIRKALLDGHTMESKAVDMMTRDFVWVAEGTPKEHILKLLDTRIRAIPILDSRRRLVDIVSTGYLAPHKEMFARAKAPVRLSLAGGGTDFTRYFMEHGGISLSTTVARHAHAVLKRREDDRIRICSHDLNLCVEYDDHAQLPYDGRLDIVKAGINVMRPGFGFDLWVGSDVPVGSGLGGSASLLAAVISVLNEFRENKLDRYTIAEQAFEAERVELKIAGGWQDQYSTVFGGFNVIEYDSSHNMVTPLRLQPETLMELEERFILCFTGESHRGGEIQKANRSRSPDDSSMLRFANNTKEIVCRMRNNLLRGNLSDFGRMLNETWKLKKSLNRQVTSSALDDIYNAAIAAGAEGGRLLGTGGGGFFLFFVKPFHRFEVARAMAECGLETESVVLDDRGVQSWVSHVT